MLTTTSELRGSRMRRILALNPDARCKRAAELTEELEHCDREIATAMAALLTGSAPIVDALLWYTDWCRERELILLASDEAEIGRT